MALVVKGVDYLVYPNPQNEAKARDVAEIFVFGKGLPPSEAQTQGALSRLKSYADIKREVISQKGRRST